MTYDTIPIPGGGFIKLMRSDATRELLKDSKAFGLLTQIALRAKRTADFNIHGLTPGQALIGDHENCGLSPQEYRRAKMRLQRYGLARFKGTNRGTIATLCGQTIYDINVTTLERTENDQGTTIKKEKREKKEKNEKKEKKEKKFLLSCSSGSKSRRVAATFEEMDRAGAGPNKRGVYER